MKKILIVTLALFVASCASCNKEDEDWTPCPGCLAPTKEQSKTQS